MLFFQIRSTDETGTLSYIIADPNTRNGIIIDPNIEDLNLMVELISKHQITPRYVVDTHTHADHVSAAGELKKLYNTKLLMHPNTRNKWKVVDEGDKFGIGDILRANAALEVDVFVDEGDELLLDSIKGKFIFTPGHTDNHISLLVDEKLFTGDLLLIGQAGRSDLPGGNAEDQYTSLFDKVLKLPDNVKIYPGHDYEDNEYSLLADEKKNNPFLKDMSKDEYVKFVKDFFPPISETTSQGKATLQCGTKRVTSETKESFHEINAQDLSLMLTEEPDIFLLDVREPFELLAFGAIPGVVNIPGGRIMSKLQDIPLNKKIVVICQSGNRSLEVAHFLSKKGFEEVYNLEGGTSGWIYNYNYPVEYNKVS